MRGKLCLVLSLLLGSLFFSFIAFGAPQSLAIILDASNSMNKPFGTESRLEVAKGALVDLLGVLPEGIDVGLFVYGHRIGKEDREASCKDIETFFPIRPFDASMAEGMAAALASVRAQGSPRLPMRWWRQQMSLLTTKGRTRSSSSAMGRRPVAAILSSLHTCSPR